MAETKTFTRDEKHAKLSTQFIDGSEMYATHSSPDTQNRTHSHSVVVSIVCSRLYCALVPAHFVSSMQNDLNFLCKFADKQHGRQPHCIYLYFISCQRLTQPSRFLSVTQTRSYYFFRLRGWLLCVSVSFSLLLLNATRCCFWCSPQTH